jgi:hypothetical protein
MSEYQSAAGVASPGFVPESRPGMPFSAGNPLPVVQAGSTGSDFSVNQPTPPVVGGNFGGSGPYAGYVLIRTVPANPTRAGLDVENSSGAQIVVVRDDGTAASGAAPTNASVFPLAGGSGAGSQGGSWSTTTFKGRLQLYAPNATAQVAVFQD